MTYLPDSHSQAAEEEIRRGEKGGRESVGNLAYECLVGEAPFKDTPIIITSRIARAEMKIPSFVSTEATDLIKKVRAEASSLNPLSGNLLTSTIVTGYQSKQRIVA